MIGFLGDDDLIPNRHNESPTSSLQHAYIDLSNFGVRILFGHNVICMYLILDHSLYFRSNRKLTLHGKMIAHIQDSLL